MFNISFFLNGKAVNVAVSPKTNVLSFLRNDYGLTGTKEACSEGDCGACTIVLGAVKNNRTVYQAVNSCLMPAVRMHGKHIITIEGIGNPEKLHPIQKAILDFHGVQCGYCSPAVVMSLFALFLNNHTPSKQEIFNALEGNLCRCTGYESIKNAAIYLSEQNKKNKQSFIPDYFNRVNNLLLSFNIKIDMSRNSTNCEHKYLLPTNLKQLFLMLKSKGTKIINGGTDLMVDINIRKQIYPTIIDISEIKELDFINEQDNTVLIGAGTTFSDIILNKTIQKRLPLLNSAILQLGSKQIRNIGTLAGNIGNASPIADAATALMALDTTLILKSKNGKRRAPIADFYKGYKITILRPNEIIFAIEVPVKTSVTSFEKTGKRKSVDIASVSSAISLKYSNNKIKNIAIAFGGVAPYPIIAQKTENFLKGKEITSKIIEQASLIAASEVKPISDLRGSAQFRRLLVRNHIIKHFIKLFPKTF